MNKTAEGPEMPTILVVDDEIEVCRLFERSLGREHYRVLGATGGKKALAMLKRHHVDLVILDIRMADMGGIDVLRRLRRQSKDIPVLMLTAHGHLDSARQAMQLGAYDYLTKPFDLKFMKKIIEEALRGATRV